MILRSCYQRKETYNLLLAPGGNASVKYSCKKRNLNLISLQSRGGILLGKGQVANFPGFACHTVTVATGQLCSGPQELKCNYKQNVWPYLAQVQTPALSVQFTGSTDRGTCQTLSHESNQQNLDCGKLYRRNNLVSSTKYSKEKVKNKTSRGGFLKKTRNVSTTCNI